MISNKVCNLGYLHELSNGNTEFVNEMIDVFLAIEELRGI